MTDELGKMGRDVTGPERADKTKKILAEGLKPEQMKRLNQIMWQKGGVATASNDPDVQAALKLTDDQKEKIKTIRADTRKAITDLGQGNAEKRAELQKKSGEDVVALLTDDQKKAWKDLVGPEFKGEIGRRPQQ